MRVCSCSAMMPPCRGRAGGIVEEGHFPAGVFDHFGAGFEVEVVEGSTLECRHGDLIARPPEEAEYTRGRRELLRGACKFPKAAMTLLVQDQTSSVCKNAKV